MREQYDRAFRFKRASQMSIIHDILPKEQWTPPQDVSLHSAVSSSHGH
jgi:ubiquinol-cytochrome c reductase subunit 7